MNRTIENIIQGLSRSLFGYRNSQRGGRCRKLAFLQEDAVERGAILRIRIKYWWPAWYRLMRIHRIPFPSLPQRFVSRLSLEEDSSSLLLPLLLSYIIVALSLYLQISAPPSSFISTRPTMNLFVSFSLLEICHAS